MSFSYCSSLTSLPSDFFYIYETRENRLKKKIHIPLSKVGNFLVPFRKIHHEYFSLYCVVLISIDKRKKKRSENQAGSAWREIGRFVLFYSTGTVGNGSETYQRGRCLEDSLRCSFFYFEIVMDVSIICVALIATSFGRRPREQLSQLEV